jgi:hypothetical protein
MNYEPRQFVHANATVSLVVAGQRQPSHYEDSGDIPVSGVITLANAAKYNVNGTWRASVTPGVYRAVFLCRGATMQAANDMADTLYDLAGRSGTLYGVEYTSTSVATHTCSAYIEAVRPLSMIDRVGANVARAHALQVELVVNRLSEWS